VRKGAGGGASIVRSRCASAGLKRGGLGDFVLAQLTGPERGAIERGAARRSPLQWTRRRAPPPKV